MHSRLRALPILIILLSLFVCSTAAYSASIKDRMAARIPTINALKDKGLIGENNKGFLEYRSSSKPEQATISSENSDRKEVYVAIAKKQGVSAVLVGERRARKIAELGKKGHWFQDSGGKWYKK